MSEPRINDYEHPHPLADVPRAGLYAARDSLIESLRWDKVRVEHIDDETVEAMADAVVMAYLTAAEMKPPVPDGAPTDAAPDLLAGVYEHYKGHQYLLLGLAHDSNADGRVAVVYVPLYEAPGPRLAIRDLDDFTAPVHRADGSRCLGGCDAADTEHQPRFRYLGTTSEERGDG